MQSSAVCRINNMLQKHKHVKKDGTSTRCPAVKGAAFVNLHEMLFLFQITKTSQTLDFQIWKKKKTINTAS